MIEISRALNGSGGTQARLPRNDIELRLYSTLLNCVFEFPCLFGGRKFALHQKFWNPSGKGVPKGCR